MRCVTDWLKLLDAKFYSYGMHYPIRRWEDGTKKRKRYGERQADEQIDRGIQRDIEIEKKRERRRRQRGERRLRSKKGVGVGRERERHTDRERERERERERKRLFVGDTGDRCLPTFP